ncbi:hypothetical protein [Caballeronia sp. BR00000012568055]|uniref:hypothetical protein n=1 Tax=Caballeronia sp. BR00000012568055 TaxID=2918761 RepID=UPI0023F61C23|nr:hypothetical protein [Caballeronia sp. BR00000012568055]
MNTPLLVCVLIALLLLASCSQDDRMFAMTPVFKTLTDADEPTVAACIASRWKSGTRDFSRIDDGNVIRLRAQTFFDGVSIGVRVQPAAGKTRIEYFERRYADRIYIQMIRGCVQDSMPK